nr:FeoA domain-containing protein [Bryobacterales bacterium]
MTWILVAFLLALAWLLWRLLSHPSMPAGHWLRRRRTQRERALWEDALRQILLLRQQGSAASEVALAGAMNLSRKTVRTVLLQMLQHQLVQSSGPNSQDVSAFQLTPTGERWAIHVLRAHRLWESYLADEARLPMDRLHHQAEQAEHRLSERDLEALDAHLGYPQQDPHGDPIPSAQGVLPRTRGTALHQWNGANEVLVVHVEDEPPELLQQLLTLGVRPGAHLHLISNRPGVLEAEVDGQLSLLPHEVLANIEVEADLPSWANDPCVRKLSQLHTGEHAEVVALSEAIRGFSRRRLMDFGVTRGAAILPVLDNPFGDPRAYRVRGATIGIRKEQADQVWVRVGE